MSYTGVGEIGNHVAHEAPAASDTDLVAARDIVRRNPLGQNVVVVPAGQPIPSGLIVDPDEAAAAPAPPTAPPPDPGQLRRSEPDLSGSYARSRRLERLIWLGTRRGP